MVTEEDLQLCIKAYNENKIGFSPLIAVFRRLAKDVWDLPSYRFDGPENVLDEAAELCFTKLSKYNRYYNNAWNFFVTVIGCYLRQTKRTQINIKKFRDIKKLQESNNGL